MATNFLGGSELLKLRQLRNLTENCDLGLRNVNQPCIYLNGVASLPGPPVKLDTGLYNQNYQYAKPLGLYELL